MKIFHVIDFYAPEIGSFSANVTEQLANRGHEVTVLTSNYYSTSLKFPAGEKNIKENLNVKRYNSVKFGINRAIYPHVIKDLISCKADIIHAYGLGFFSSFVCGYLRLIKRTPLVLRADFNIYEKRSILKVPYNFFWRQIPVYNADVITVHMKKMKDILQKKYNVGTDKIEIMPHGIEFEKFSNAESARDELNLLGKFVILNVSRADGAKDPNKIIHALALLKKATDKFVFIHIGAYYQKEYYDKMAETINKLGLKDNVRLVGYIPHEEILKYYKSADVYVQSSNEESFCLSTLEAMASGLPVIATRTGAIGYEWFDEYDYWFNTTEELGKKLIYLFENNHERKKLGKLLENIAKQHDWKFVIKKLEKIYEKALL